MVKRFLGMDLSLSSPGFSVIELRDGIPLLVHVSHRKTNPKQSHGGRLEDIRAELSTIYAKYKPFDAIIREKGFSHHAATTQAIFKVVGVTEWYLRGHKIEEISPTTVKKTLTGDGKASKDDVAQAVKRYVGDVDFVTDDESDATAVILAHLIREGMLKT